VASCFETTSNRIPQINSNVYCVPKIKDKQKNMTQQKLIHGNSYVCFVLGAFISPTNFDAFLYVSYTFSFMYNADKILY
jgi:hypothetical protein